MPVKPNFAESQIKTRRGTTGLVLKSLLVVTKLPPLFSSLGADAENANNTERVWSRFGTRGKDWKFGQVHLTSGSVPDGATKTLVAFKGVVGGWQGDIAIDDIRLIEGSCPPARKCHLFRAI